MKVRRRVRLEDIAKEVGLTKVSVSKALRDHPDISSETKTKIRAVARRLGYTPNFIARSLSSRRSNMIGVIVPKVAHSFFSWVIESIYASATRSQYEIIMCVSQENARLERKHIETLLGMRVDGILVSVSEETTDPEPFRAVTEAGVPMVMFDRALGGLDVSTVTVDDRKGAYDGVSFMIDQGCKIIAHLAGYNSVKIGEERRRGYESALKDAGIAIDEQLIIEGGFGERDGYFGFKELYQSGRIAEVQGLFAVTFPVGLGAYDAALDLGVSMDETSIITFGGGDLNRFLSHPMICIDQPARDIGSRAISLLIDEIENVDAKVPQHVILPTRIQVLDRRGRTTRSIATVERSAPAAG